MTDNIRGALWILASALAATAMGVGVKSLAGAVPSMQTAFGRSIVGLILLLPFLLSRQHVNFRSPKLPVHILRGLLGVVAINCGFYTLTQLPIATVTVLFFTAPLFVTILAPIMLGEEVGWRRWSATAVGFAGTLIVLNPGTRSFEPTMLLAVGSSALFAIILLIGKRLSETEQPGTLMFYASVIMTIGCLPPAAWVWTPPTMTEWLLIGLVGFFGMARSYFDIKGFAIGEASFVAPFQYVRLIFIGVAGYVLFDEAITLNTLIGAAVIFSSTFYIARRDAIRRKTDWKPPVEP